MCSSKFRPGPPPESAQAISQLVHELFSRYIQRGTMHQGSCFNDIFHLVATFFHLNLFVLNLVKLYGCFMQTLYVSITMAISRMQAYWL